VLPAVTFDEILNRAELYGQHRPLHDRLVSIVFANPTSPVWADLHGNRAMLDVRSGSSWDLFFAGLSGYHPMPHDRNSVRLQASSRRKANFLGYFNPRSFDQIVGDVEHGQRRAFQAAHDPRAWWRYSGGTDLVSFMVYGREPDWLSLHDVSLYTRDGTAKDLSQVSEGLARWQEDLVDPDLAPGEFRPDIGTVGGPLARALQWTAAVVTGGVMGNAAYELLTKVLQ